MGPSLALVDATLSRDVSQVHLLRHHFRNQTLATAAATVTQRAMTLRDEFDEELVVELTHAHLATWGAYDEFRSVSGTDCGWPPEQFARLGTRPVENSATQCALPSHGKTT